MLCGPSMLGTRIVYHKLPPSVTGAVHKPMSQRNPRCRPRHTKCVVIAKLAVAFPVERDLKRQPNDSSDNESDSSAVSLRVEATVEATTSMFFTVWFGLVRTGRSLRHPRRPTTAASACVMHSIISEVGSCSALVTPVLLAVAVRDGKARRISVRPPSAGLSMSAISNLRTRDISEFQNQKRNRLQRGSAGRPAMAAVLSERAAASVGSRHHAIPILALQVR